MAEGSGSVAAVAIVVLVLIGLGAGYILFLEARSVSTVEVAAPDAN